MYVIVADPAATPVTKPEVLTLATLLSLVDQVPPVVAESNCVDKPAQTEVAPVIPDTTGN